MSPTPPSRSLRWLGALATVLAASGCAAPLTPGPGPSAEVVPSPQPAEIFASLDCVGASKKVSGSARGAVPNNFDAVEAVWCEPVAPVDGFGLPRRTDDVVAETDFVIHRSADVDTLVELSRQPNDPCENPDQMTGQQPHFLPIYVTDASGSAAIIDWPMTSCSRQYSVDRAEIVEQTFGVQLPEEWDGGWSGS
ncbi:hypothetical protein [Lysinibacter cavernae]|uniref:DUF3558 domain-containing protein n=1 Tax=Lysinibacter cavernae TaxID=1640652 RepID=A0A7X5R139_9MICO|nr:hypothetical protein [Lysinibacter cavernae]NIH53656.1 hypothetical protein [Lysinibacter cavernae]